MSVQETDLDDLEQRLPLRAPRSFGICEPLEPLFNLSGEARYGEALAAGCVTAADSNRAALS